MNRGKNRSLPILYVWEYVKTSDKNESHHIPIYFLGTIMYVRYCLLSLTKTETNIE